MRAFALPPDRVDDGVIGCILCNDIVSAGAAGRVKLGKGRVLDVDDLEALKNYSGELHLLELAPGDVHEDGASTRLAAAVAGEGLEARGPVESQTHLRATRRGLVQVDALTLERINSLPDMSVFTLYDGQPVDIGKAVAAIKVTPLAVPAGVLEEAERIASEAAPVVCVRPFLGGSVGVVVRDRYAGSTRAKFEAAIHMKVGWFGSTVAGITYLPEDVQTIAAAIEGYREEGVTLILAAGVNSTDPLDLTLQALERVGATTERRGVPAHPGSTCWLAYLDRTPIFGLALCGMFSQTTVLDLLLPRFLSGQRVRREDVATLGYGGLLGKDMAFRFPAYVRDSRE